MFHKSTSQTQLLFVLTIPAVVIMAGCATMRKAWEEPKLELLLQYRMPEGPVLKYQTSNEFIQNIEVLGQSVGVQMNRDYVFSITSKGLKGDNYQLGIIIDSMTATVVTLQGELSPDMGSVVGKSFGMTLSPLGKELDVFGADSIQYEVSPGSKRSILPDFETMFPDVAGKSVKIGDTWTTHDTITVKESTTELHIITESENTLTGFETVNGLECARITAVVTGTLDGEGEQQGVQLTWEGELEGTDTWYFAYKEGLFVKMISNCNVEGTITTSDPQNPTIPIKQEIKIETKLISAGQVPAEEFYYGIEINGVLCGYSEIKTSPMIKDGNDMILLEQRGFLMLSALGAEFNSELKFTYHIDPITGKFTYHDSYIKQGPTELNSAIYIERDTARFTSTLTDEEIITQLPQDVILENTLMFPHLIKDFVDNNLDEKTYEIYEVREQEVQKSTYTKVGTEKLELVGNTYNAIILDRLSHKTGLKLRWWLDAENGYLLKAVYSNRMSYLTDPSVVKKIKIANLDENITSKVNVSIADVPAISYMKVKATIEPVGLWVTPEGLNVPGQQFTGTVKENLIEGIFEIEHKRYDGLDAPPFPADFSKDDSLKEYMDPDEFIESDDPVLLEKAREITNGSKDAWEAACLLSQWVADNINYAIPGGGTARKTYDMRSGECGAHSILLAAFCRGVGIPARVVWGCMYVPNFGGCFGQHAWNEIYMGKAGWVPVDATAFEIDYVDCGHIRIGVLQSAVTALNPKEMEVLDYRVGTAGTDTAETAMYEEYVGEYTNAAINMELKVFVQDGNLTVDIPEKVVLALNDPDEEGLWYSKISNKLYFTFEKNDPGKIIEMQLHEIISMPKKSSPEEVDEKVPEKFRAYLGKYLFAAVQAEFTVLYKDGSLAVYNPLDKDTVQLQPPDEKGRWLDEFNKNTIFFELVEEGNVRSMNVDSVTRFQR